MILRSEKKKIDEGGTRLETDETEAAAFAARNSRRYYEEFASRRKGLDGEGEEEKLLRISRNTETKIRCEDEERERERETRKIAGG